MPRNSSEGNPDLAEEIEVVVRQQALSGDIPLAIGRRG